MHHRAAARRAHRRHRVAHRVDHRFEVDRHDPVPQVEIDVEQRLVAAEPQHAGCVDQVIEPAVRLQRLSHRLCDERLVGQVAGEDQRAVEPVRGRIDVDGRDQGATGQQVARDIAAHAARRAGDEGGLAVEAHVKILCGRAAMLARFDA